MRSFLCCVGSPTPPPAKNPPHTSLSLSLLAFHSFSFLLSFFLMHCMEFSFAFHFFSCCLLRIFLIFQVAKARENLLLLLLLWEVRWENSLFSLQGNLLTLPTLAPHTFFYVSYETHIHMSGLGNFVWCEGKQIAIFHSFFLFL